ncbi:hypothetical protein [Streptomyces sedi]|uniref:hypothetical protein n=1 Tax=Streptomyces sedi TaxID=555059 RepID=UPI001B861F61|nr:hypothetical protein [Streptomyces sedi]
MRIWDELGVDFDAEVRELALSQRPRLFAVVQVFGEDEDAVVAAWGMRQEDGRFDVVSDDGRRVMRLRTLDRVLLPFQRVPEVSARVVWADPEPEADVVPPPTATVRPGPGPHLGEGEREGEGDAEAVAGRAPR